ncbi:nuclear receptor-interacting protein 3-like [Engraulis encrasicolus]|uniref:nuclear receptor-interacting protein 3-like n=1 Tax=Engraulis encrasicolus TaxID=184585 RepID=UPI002FD2A441
MEMRDTMRQQRRIKQAIQFLHKDSADLLPLDGLNKLGTSKEWQPHTILQRRILEANLCHSKSNNNHGGPKQLHNNPCRPLLRTAREEEDSELVHVVGKCCGRDVPILVDTGCAVNLISTVSVEKMGVKDKVVLSKTELDNQTMAVCNIHTQGHVDLSLSFGQVKADSTFIVVDPL